MKKLDELLESGAQWLAAQAERQRTAGDGWRSKLADELADDAEFLRKLKPSLIAARARGAAPTDQQPGAPAPGSPSRPAPAAPSRPQLGPRPKPRRRGGARERSGPNPFVVAGAALALGIVLAKVVDWRGREHPGD